MKHTKMTHGRSVCALLLVALCAAATAGVSGPLAPTDLRTQNMPPDARTRVVLASTDVPKFAWRREHTENGQTQSAAHVQVLDEERAIVWDSQAVATCAARIEYRGRALRCTLN